MTFYDDVLAMAYLVHPSERDVESITQAVEQGVYWRAVREIPDTMKLTIGGLYFIEYDVNVLFYSSKLWRHKFTPTLPNISIGYENFGRALLCSSIQRYSCGNISGMLDWSKIQADAISAFQDLKPHLYLPYSEAIVTEWNSFSALYNRVKHDLRRARGAYRDIVISRANDYAILHATGAWDSSSSELYHHWMKYMALGATANEVDQFIKDAKLAGLPVVWTVDVQFWRTYSYYGFVPFGTSSFDGEAREKVLVNHNLAVGGEGRGSCCGLSRAYANTAWRYRYPSSSCFRAGTVVMMEDRKTLSPIEHLEAGDKIWSPSAGAAVNVALIARPLVSGRSLYALNGEKSFQFTSAHPFVLHTEHSLAGHVACVDPIALSHSSPTWSAFGIESLEASSSTLEQLIIEENGNLLESAMKVRSIEVVEPAVSSGSEMEWIQAVKENPSSREMLYDVILETTELCDGVPVDYVAGSRNMLLRVATEVPPVAAADPNVLIIMKSIIGAIMKFSSGFDDGLRKIMDPAEKWQQQVEIECRLQRLQHNLLEKWFCMAISLAVYGSSETNSLSLTKGGEYIFGNNNSDGQCSFEEFELQNAVSNIGAAFFERYEDGSRTNRGLAKSDNSNPGSFRSIMAKLYDAFIISHVQELRGFLDLGFRVFSVPPPTVALSTNEPFHDDHVLAVSVWGIEFHASKLQGHIPHCRHASVAEMEVSIGSKSLATKCEALRFQGPVADYSANMKFWSSSSKKRILYFSLSDSSAIGSNECKVEVRVKVCESLKLEGYAMTNVTAGRKYKHLFISLDESVGMTDAPLQRQRLAPKPFVEQAKLWADVRVLTSAQVEQERTRSAKVWPPERTRQQAMEFASTAGQAYQLVASEYLKQCRTSLGVDQQRV
ncbi:unnamed protein product [Agarophyton chilense]